MELLDSISSTVSVELKETIYVIIMIAPLWATSAELSL
jgi:hypothetical protein